MRRTARTLFAALMLIGVAGVMPSADAAAIQGKEMTLPATERTVKVEYFRAPGNAKRPAILMLHGGQGWGGAEGRIENFRQYGSELAAHGFDAYMVYYYSDQDAKDRAANALHSRTDLLDRHQGGGGRKRDTEESGRTQGRGGSSYLHVYVRERGSQFSYTDQVLAGQAERW